MLTQVSAYEWICLSEWGGSKFQNYKRDWKISIIKFNKGTSFCPTLAFGRGNLLKLKLYWGAMCCRSLIATENPQVLILLIITPFNLITFVIQTCHFFFSLLKIWKIFVVWETHEFKIIKKLLKLTKQISCKNSCNQHLTCP